MTLTATRTEVEAVTDAFILAMKAGMIAATTTIVEDLGRLLGITSSDWRAAANRYDAGRARVPTHRPVAVPPQAETLPLTFRERLAPMTTTAAPLGNPATPHRTAQTAPPAVPMDDDTPDPAPERTWLACTACGKTRAWPERFPRRSQTTCDLCQWRRARRSGYLRKVGEHVIAEELVGSRCHRCARAFAAGDRVVATDVVLVHAGGCAG